MAKKKKNAESTVENYYDLKIDKVDELVAALKEEGGGNSGEISMNVSDCTGVDDPQNITYFGRQKKFDPYKSDFLGRVPVWIKAFFVKFWFAGMVCFFFMWGISMADTLDSIFICGVVLGIVTDVLVNPLFRYMETDRREFNNYMMFPFPFKAFWTFFTNVIYYIFVVFGTNMLYFAVNEIANIANGTSSVVYLAVEPVLFGVFTLIADMLLIGIKDLIVYLVLKSKRSAVNV